MDISQIGEFGLIQRIKESLGPQGHGQVLGIGDDCAAFEGPPGMLILATCDAQVEGVHFLPDAMTPAQIGQKAAAINISDIAAMGGQPTFMLISLGLPKNTSVSFVDGLYQGLKEECQRHKVQVIGGNMAQCPERVFIDITLLGQVEQGRTLFRAAARPGDLVAVSGNVGDSSAGLALVLSPETRVNPEAKKRVLAAHFQPSPKVKYGRALALSGLVHAALDLSDGTVQDLGHVCEESRLGAVIDAGKIPVSRACREAASALDRDPLEFALFGGEDYELLFTFAEHNQNRLEKALYASGLTMSVIGRMESGDAKVSILNDQGQLLDAKSTGWNHFQK